jgi:hypothetical protein
MMSFACVLSLATLVAFIVVILGGKQQRENGWVVLTSMLSLVGLIECACMAIVAYLFDNDERFFPGWELDKSFIFCTVSWSVAILSAVAISLAAYILPPEDGYELIPSEQHYPEGLRY